MKISLAFSPCPNDTFMFHGVATDRQRVEGYEFDVHLHDIETLNRRAIEGAYDITKLSFHAYLLASERYRLLDTGAALGFGCGPILVSTKPMSRRDVLGGRIAIPGELTTAHLLFRLWAPEAHDKVFVTYDRIMDMVASGEVDCGVIIHEGRFVFEDAGLRAVVDLGQWWEETTQLAVPLGGIAIRRSLPEDLADRFDELVRRSILDARSGDADVLPFIRQHAQEMDEDVLTRHIDTFVNESSLGLGPDGVAAVTRLEEMARDAGVIP